MNKKLTRVLGLTLTSILMLQPLVAIASPSSQKDVVIEDMRVSGGYVTAVVRNDLSFSLDVRVELNSDKGDYAVTDLGVLDTGESVNMSIPLSKPLEYKTTTFQLKAIPYDGFYEEYDESTDTYYWTSYNEYFASAAITLTPGLQLSEPNLDLTYGDSYSNSIAIATKIVERNNEKLNSIVMTKKGWDNQGTANILAGVLNTALLTIPENIEQANELNKFMRDNLADNATVYYVGVDTSLEGKYQDTESEIGYNVVHIIGKDLTELSINVAKEILDKRTNAGKAPIIVASKNSFADEASIAPFAIRNQLPILLVDNSIPVSEHSEIVDFVVGEDLAKTLYVTGGEYAVPSNSEYLVKVTSNSVSYRLGGSDRYETNNLINSNLYNGEEAKTISVSEEDTALAGSVLAGLTGRTITLAK